MNCEKCGKSGAHLKVGLGERHVCHECSKLYRQMSESLRLEYVEKLKESEEYFFGSGKEELLPPSIFIDNEEEYETVFPNHDDLKEEDKDTQELPQELFG